MKAKIDNDNDMWGFNDLLFILMMKWFTIYKQTWVDWMDKIDLGLNWSMDENAWEIEKSGDKRERWKLT